MGSLTSRPDIPQVRQQPVIVTIPSVPPPVQTVSSPPAAASAPQQQETTAPASTSDNETPVEGTSNEEAQRLVREDNLLRRSRGRLSTVLTGFSGLLSQTVGNSARKTLLGE